MLVAARMDNWARPSTKARAGRKSVRELISEDAIQERIGQIADEINADYCDVVLLNLVIVLRGGCFFGIDLSKRLRMPCRLDYIRVTSYSGSHSTGVVSLMSDVKTDLRG